MVVVVVVGLWWSRATDERGRRSLQAPMVMVRGCRLRFLARVAQRAPRALQLQLLAASAGRRSWFRAVTFDYECVQAHADQDVTTRLPQVRGPADLLARMCADPRALRRALQAYLQDPAVSRASHWATPRQRRDLTHSACPVCGQTFRSRQAAAVHAFRSHGLTQSWRQALAEPTCPCCLQHFWTRSRLLEHVAKSERCAAFSRCLPPLNLVELQQIELEEAAAARRRHAAGQRRHVVLTPAVRAQGPLAHHAVLLGISHRAGLRTASRAAYPLCAWRD